VLICRGCTDLSRRPKMAKLLGIKWFLGVSVREMTRLLTGGFLVLQRRILPTTGQGPQLGSESSFTVTDGRLAISLLSPVGPPQDLGCIPFADVQQMVK